MNTETFIFLLICVFAGMFTGWLFRNIGIIKVLLMLFALPYILAFFVGINYWATTGAFLIGAIGNFAYLGRNR